MRLFFKKWYDYFKIRKSLRNGGCLFTHKKISMELYSDAKQMHEYINDWSNRETLVQSVKYNYVLKGQLDVSSVNDDFLGNLVTVRLKLYKL